MSITSEKGLAALPAPQQEAIPVPNKDTVEPSSTWTIPAPADGFAYTVEEIADLAGVKPQTVQVWASRGVNRRGRFVKLQLLRVPRGRVAAPALCQFLSLANKIEVRVGTPPPTGRRT